MTTVPVQDESSAATLIAQIWCDVLGQSECRQAANFFACGGDSVLAARLVSRINATLGTQLSVRAVFENPTPSELASSASASAVAGGEPSSSNTPSLRKRFHRERSVLSFSQERMWFMYELTSATAAYHVPLAIRFRGRPDEEALRSALANLAKRHEVVRTTFFTTEGGVIARINPLDPPKITIKHLQESAVHQYLVEAANAPFQLQQGPLLRVHLLHISPTESVLLLVVHHIICDQWALYRILEELAAEYTSALTGESSAPRSEMNFHEYAAWHRRWFMKERHEIELAYWRRELQQLEPVELPADFPRPPQKSFRGSKVRCPLTHGDLSRLTQLGMLQDASLAMVLLAALNVMLMRHTGRKDIAVGLPVANRQQLVADRLVGTCVNTLVLRTDASGDPDFLELLGRVKKKCLAAFEHQDMPFERLVQALQLERDASHSPLFSVMFNMLNMPIEPTRFADLEWSVLDFDKQASQFDLTVTVDPKLSPAISFEYSTDLFTAETMKLFAARYMQLLHVICETPRQRLSRLPMLSPLDQSLISQWSCGPRSDDLSVGVLSRFKSICDRTPLRTALVFRDQKWTYGELDTASSEIADALRERDIGPGDRVGICLQRTPLLSIAQLAILKSGAAYVPLDPAYPKDRLIHMAEDAQLTLLATESALNTRIDWRAMGCTSIELDQLLADRPATGARTPRAPDPLAASNQAAYVIYTSGSSGRPKGVVVSHDSLANFVGSMLQRPGISAQDRVLAVTTLSFDIAVLELLAPLCVGAQVVVAEQDDLTDPDRLQRLLTKHAITLMQATPGTWRMLIAAGWQGAEGLKALCGGEPLPGDLAAQLAPRCDQLWNMYGPTETTVWSTCALLSDPERRPISLGRPIHNTHLFVLDEQKEPCPIGVPGELYIGGAGLARGYFNRPELTAARFFENVSIEDRLYRLYGTGDQVRWLADGTLEHLGRLDNQIKVRGYRIEVGEIESQLQAHPMVAECVVLAREEQVGDVRLEAYIVSRESSLPEPPQMREHLRKWLPDYMLPQAFIRVDSIPRLPNGKIDRKALQGMRDRPASAQAHVAPRTTTEAALWRIWSELLNTSMFGVRHDFFDLGGHSMLAMQVVNRIRQELQRACTLAMIFRYTTVEALSEALESSSKIKGEALIPLQPVGEATPLFCLCGIHIYQEFAELMAPHIPVYGVFVPSELERFSGDSQEAVDSELVKRLAGEYLHTVRTQQPAGPYRLFGFSFGGVLAYEIAQQLNSAGESVEYLAILDSDAPRIVKADAASSRYRLRLALQDLRLTIANRITTRAFRLIGKKKQQISNRAQKYLEATRSYRALPYPGPAVYFEAVDAEPCARVKQWSALISSLEVRRIKADHMSLLKTPSVVEIASAVQAHLGTARTDQGGAQLDMRHIRDRPQ